DWDSQEAMSHEVIWWSRLDKRYQVEVRRDAENEYRGRLYIFDHADDDRLLHDEEVPVAYGALFGPDMDDIVSWQEKTVAFLDEDQPV
ncbi:MAG TPA: hypothetical protein VHA37_03840, partial [Candidatus Saccharimonadales bacterium]|nr:hypothetical protein [Candidatus Saccharimonadales bacterium]